jgi:hypothetical protein
MRPLHELIDESEPAWATVEQWIDDSEVEVEVLPTDRATGEAALYATQVTSRSPMGAIALNTAGLLLASGWLRILGAGGHARFQRSLPGWNEGRSSGFYLIGDDVVGGSFAINGGALGDDRGSIYYHAPDSLRWESCKCGYSEFLVWAMTESLHVFYQPLRWDGWHLEVSKLTGDQALSIYPFLFTEGPPIKDRSSRAVPVAEQYDLQLDIQRQLDGNK